MKRTLIFVSIMALLVIAHFSESNRIHAASDDKKGRSEKNALTPLPQQPQPIKQQLPKSQQPQQIKQQPPKSQQIPQTKVKSQTTQQRQLDSVRSKNIPRTPSMSRINQQKIRTSATPTIPSLENVKQRKQDGGKQVDTVRSDIKQRQIKQQLERSRQPQNNKKISDKQKQDAKAQFKDHDKRDSQVSGQVRDKVRRNHPERRHWFDDQFFARHHYTPGYHHHGDDWWRPAQWGGLVIWLNGGWNYPIYYGVGGYPVDVLPDMNTSLEAVQGNPQINQISIQGDWLPLGVFTAGTDAVGAALSNMFIQIAVNQSGQLAGTYYNALIDQTYPLEGEIDMTTQEAAWTISDNQDAPIMTTGIYNLTLDVVPVQVHFQDQEEQSWTLIRID